MPIGKTLVRRIDVWTWRASAATFEVRFKVEWAVSYLRLEMSNAGKRTESRLSKRHAPTTRLIALRIHLDDSNADNGPLRVLPGSHALGVLSDEATFGLAKTIPCVDCQVPRGGVIAMRPLIVHAS
jgi:hypothetical protein